MRSSRSVSDNTTSESTAEADEASSVRPGDRGNEPSLWRYANRGQAAESARIKHAVDSFQIHEHWHIAGRNVGGNLHVDLPHAYQSRRESRKLNAALRHKIGIDENFEIRIGGQQRRGGRRVPVRGHSFDDTLAGSEKRDVRSSLGRMRAIVHGSILIQRGNLTAAAAIDSKKRRRNGVDPEQPTCNYFSRRCPHHLNFLQTSRWRCRWNLEIDLCGRCVQNR